MARLAAVVGDAPFIFVVGKGGVGKTTIASALAVDLADASGAVHLISTDPAHSLHDVIVDANACSPRLTVEEFDATSYADAWLDRARAPIADLLENGTYLDRDDIAGFTTLALPGVDELMAVLRLVELDAGGARVVVDTAPTGHMLRLLDAANVHEGIVRALRALADKAAAVASSLSGRAVRLGSEALIDELDTVVRSYRERVLRRAVFVVAVRAGSVVEAETIRLKAALEARHGRVVATVWTGPAGEPRDAACFMGAVLPVPPRGCTALRAWSDALEPCTASEPARGDATVEPFEARAPALAWLLTRQPPLWLFAGKGGVGKTTCAAAFALALAQDHDVLLCSADPAGSLTDVLAGGEPPPRLRVTQLDAAAELQRLHDLYRADVIGALDSMGLAEAAALDRRVIESLWAMAPPGIDEIAGLIALLDTAAADQTVVVDMAPTGHFLRLLDMPELALDWARQLMRVLVKYGVPAGETRMAEALLSLARELRALRASLHDAQHTATILVTLPEPVVNAETDRLRERLRATGVPLLATIVNRAIGDMPRGERVTRGMRPDEQDMVATAVRTDEPVIVAAQQPAPPVGISALREFAAAWKIVA